MQGLPQRNLHQLHSVKNGILWSACSSCQKKDADLVKRALTHTAKFDEHPSKKFQKMVTKVQWLLLKITRQLGCVFQDMEPPKSSSILRKSSNILKPFRCVRFTEAVLRHANIRDQNPSLGFICPGDLHQRNPNAPKNEGLVSRTDGMARAMCP